MKTLFAATALASVLALSAFADPIDREGASPIPLRVDGGVAGSHEDAAKLLNAALNRLSWRKERVVVRPSSFVHGVVEANVQGVLWSGQVAALQPNADPVPLQSIYEKLEQPVVDNSKPPKLSYLDGVSKKSDLEQLAGFEEKKLFMNDATVAQLVKLPERGFASRTPLYAKDAPAPKPPAIEMWIITAPNGSMRQYFFSQGGERVSPARASKISAEAQTDFRKYVEDEIARLEGLTKDQPDTVVLARNALQTDLSNWRSFRQMDLVARRSSNEATPEEQKRFAAKSASLAPRNPAPAPGKPSH